jgi:hypothetical protein
VACAWAIVLGAPLLIAAWLAEALRWYQQGQGTVLDGAGGWGSASTWGMRVDAVSDHCAGGLGWMFLLLWNTFSGSYLAFTSTSRR